MCVHLTLGFSYFRARNNFSILYGVQSSVFQISFFCSLEDKNNDVSDI